MKPKLKVGKTYNATMSTFPAPESDKLTQPKRELTKLITNILINYINN